MSTETETGTVVFVTNTFLFILWCDARRYCHISEWLAADAPKIGDKVTVGGLAPSNRPGMPDQCVKVRKAVV